MSFSSTPSSLPKAACLIAVSGLLAALTMASPPARAGDATAGKDVFLSECSKCHSVEKGRNKKGPSLYGVVGRPSGSVPDYHYSDAMKNVNWVWTADKLRSYLAQPAKQAVPGAKMKYDGLPDTKQLDDLISYLSTLH